MNKRVIHIYHTKRLNNKFIDLLKLLLEEANHFIVHIHVVESVIDDLTGIIGTANNLHDIKLIVDRDPKLTILHFMKPASVSTAFSNMYTKQSLHRFYNKNCFLLNLCGIQSNENQDEFKELVFNHYLLLLKEIFNDNQLRGRIIEVEHDTNEEKFNYTISTLTSLLECSIYFNKRLYKVKTRNVKLFPSMESNHSLPNETKRYLIENIKEALIESAESFFSHHKNTEFESPLGKVTLCTYSGNFISLSVALDTFKIKSGFIKKTTMSTMLNTWMEEDILTHSVSRRVYESLPECHLVNCSQQYIQELAEDLIYNDSYILLYEKINLFERHPYLDSFFK